MHATAPVIAALRTNTDTEHDARDAFHLSTWAQVESLVVNSLSTGPYHLHLNLSNSSLQPIHREQLYIWHFNIPHISKTWHVHRNFLI
jgi:hypothetical protein